MTSYFVICCNRPLQIVMQKYETCSVSARMCKVSIGEGKQGKYHTIPHIITHLAHMSQTMCICTVFWPLGDMLHFPILVKKCQNQKNIHVIQQKLQIVTGLLEGSMVLCILCMFHPLGYDVTNLNSIMIIE